MTDEQKILKLMQMAFIEIRYQAQMQNVAPTQQPDDVNPQTIVWLADLFHNVPVALSSPKANPSQLLASIIEKSQQHQGLTHWVQSNLTLMQEC